jgi:hypothetical protein
MYYVVFLIATILFMSIVAWKDAQVSAKKRVISVARQED